MMSNVAKLVTENIAAPFVVVLCELVQTETLFVHQITFIAENG